LEEPTVEKITTAPCGGLHRGVVGYFLKEM